MIGISGVATIRAFGDTSAMEAKNLTLIRGALEPFYLQQAAGLWLGIRLQCMGAVLSSLTAVILLAEYGNDPFRSSLVGFALTQAQNITGTLSAARISV